MVEGIAEFFVGLMEWISYLFDQKDHKEKIKKAALKERNRIAYLKLTGQRITINLQDCIVKTSSNSCVLEYEWQNPYEHGIKKIFVSGDIFHDKQAITFYMSNSGQAVIYYNKEIDSYYFDLSFQPGNIHH